MSDHADALQDGIDDLYEFAGVEAVYTDQNGTPVSCTVLIQRNLTDRGDQVPLAASEALIRVRKTEVATLPRRGESFAEVASGKTWYVNRESLETAFESEVVAA